MYRSPLWIFCITQLGSAVRHWGGNTSGANLASDNFTDDLRRLCDDPVNFPLIGTFFSCIVTRPTDNETPSEEDLCPALPSPARHSKFPIPLTGNSIHMRLWQAQPE